MNNMSIHEIEAIEISGTVYPTHTTTHITLLDSDRTAVLQIDVYGANDPEPATISLGPAVLDFLTKEDLATQVTGAELIQRAAAILAGKTTEALQAMGPTNNAKADAAGRTISPTAE